MEEVGSFVAGVGSFDAIGIGVAGAMPIFLQDMLTIYHMTMPSFWSHV
jgi:hypothetical protein